MGADFVRRAQLDDARRIAETQISSWLVTPGVPANDPLVPDLEEATRLWERSIFLPPSDRHEVWVATSEDEVVGVGAITPATDPDLTDRSACELLLFTIDPKHRRQGHGSRLLSAVVHAMAATAAEAVFWLNSQDDQTRSFLEKAGWATDGAHRSLSAVADPSPKQQLRQLRLSTVISPETEAVD